MTWYVVNDLAVRKIFAIVHLVSKLVMNKEPIQFPQSRSEGVIFFLSFYVTFGFDVSIFVMGQCEYYFTICSFVNFNCVQFCLL